MTYKIRSGNEMHATRKYTREMAIEWREILRAEKISQKKLADRLKISASTVASVLQHYEV